MSVTAYRSDDKNVTLYDICRATGLSTATVSRVMNKSPNVRPETRDRVLRAAAELGYVPSPHARALAGHKTEGLGVIFPRIASGFFAEVLEGIDEVAAERGFHLTAAFSRHRRAEEELVQQFLHERRVDVLILMNLLLPDEFVVEVSQGRMPIVLIDRPVRGENLVNVTLDNVRGAETAMDHLIQLKYKKIAIIKGPPGSYDAQQRMLGVTAAAERAGFELDPDLMWDGNFTEASGRVLMREWLDRGGPLPDAVFALNDPMALGVLDALAERNLHVPEDVALVGFDDADAARHLQLSTVHCPMREMGRVAADLAVQVVTNQQRPADRMLATEMVVRKTCGARLGTQQPHINDPLESLDMNMMQRLGLSVLVSMPLMSAEALAAEEAQLLINRGFETPSVAGEPAQAVGPSDWVLFAKTPAHMGIELTDASAHSGKQSCRLTASKDKEDFQGVYQPTAVNAGGTYRFSVWAMSDPAQPLKGATRGQVGIEWKDENDQEIERVLGPEITFEDSTQKWRLLEVSAKAPDNAVKAHFVFTMHTGTDAAGGAVLIDDASASKVR